MKAKTKINPRTYSGTHMFYILLIVVIIFGVLFVSGKVFDKNNEAGLILNTLFVSGSPFGRSSESAFHTKVKTINDSSQGALQVGNLELQKCPEIAVGLLVDVSGSMALPPEKLKGLKVALHTLSKSLNNESLIALYTFSGPDDKQKNPPQELIPFSKYRDVSSLYLSTVNSLTARGSTYTRDALSFVNPKFLQAKKDYPGYKGFSLLLFTDGIPYIYPPKPSCDLKDPQSCFSPEQDPTTSPDIAQQLKDSGVTIYTIAFNGDLDRGASDKLEEMLKKIASTPDNYYSTEKSGDLSGIFKEIGEKLCK